MIKKIILLVTLSVITAFISCSSDNDVTGPDPETAQLLGKWIHTDILVNNESKGGTSETIEFKSQGILKMNSSTGESTGTFKLKGDELKLLTIDGEFLFTLDDLTETELILYQQTDYNGEGDLDDVFLYFTKL